jgi:hypothetical protein
MILVEKILFALALVAFLAVPIELHIRKKKGKKDE